MLEDMERSEFDAAWRKSLEGAEVPPPDSVWSLIESELERSQFEGGWKGALEEAEIQPAQSSWTVIESQLVAAENIAIRGRIVFYQRLAAATALLAVLLGVMSYYYWQRNAANELALEELAGKLQVAATTATTQSDLKSNGESRPTGVDEFVQPAAPRNTPVQQASLLPEEIRYQSPTITTSQRVNDSGATAEVDSQYPYDALAGIQKRSEPDAQATIVVSPLLVDKKKEELLVPGLDKTFAQVETKNNEKIRDELWAGLSLSAGSYNPSTLNSSAPVNSNSGFTSLGRIVTPINNSSSVGSSYSVGLAMGKRVAGRWVVQGGVNYLNQSQGYTSNVIATNLTQSTAFLSNYAAPNQGTTVTYTNPYQINSILEYISVPIQAGYLIVDRKVGLQMNAGVASDFFLRNTLQDPSGQVGSLTQSGGQESVYRSVNFAGLVSTEVSLKLSRQYRISIVPGLRYMFNPALKAGVNNAYVTDIGFRFKYILR